MSARGPEPRCARNALRLIRVDAADDIALSTIVSLKKHALINTKIAVKAQEKDGR